MPDPTVQELVERLGRLEDEAAISEVFYAYGTSIDYGDRDRFLACFTADAEYVVTMRIAGVTALEFHGRDELAGYFDGHTHAPGAWHKHITTNVAATVEGDSATATSYFVRVDSGDEPGAANVIASGRYEDTLVRDNGEWRIRTRRCEVENL